MSIRNHDTELTVTWSARWFVAQPRATSYIARVALVFVGVSFIAWLALIGLLCTEESTIVFMAGGTHWQNSTLDADVFQTIRFATADGLYLEGVRSAIEAASGHRSSDEAERPNHRLQPATPDRIVRRRG